MAENQLKSEGAIPIIKSSVRLESLNLAKNELSEEVGASISNLLTLSATMQKLHLEFNALDVAGTRQLAVGLSRSPSLRYLNLKGNKICDAGMSLLATSMLSCPTLTELDVSLNEIGHAGFESLCSVLPQTNLQTLVCCKNLLSDEILLLFAQTIEGPDYTGDTQLRRFDLSSCRLTDQGLLFLISALANNSNIS